MATMRHVLVALADGAGVGPAIDLGVELAAVSGADIRFLHVEEPSAWQFRRPGRAVPLVRHLETGGDSTLVVAARAAAARDVPATVEHLSGDEVELILGRADDLDADVIVVGAGGRGRMPWRSVSDEVAGRSLRSVLVARRTS